MSKVNQVSKNVISEKESTDGKPLDFSFKGIKELKELQYIDARQGIRKPKKEIEEPKEEGKNQKENSKGQQGSDDANKQSEKDDKQNYNNGENQEGAHESENQKGDTQFEKNENGEYREKDKNQDPKNKEETKKGPEIIRLIPQSTIQNVLQTHNVQLNATNVQKGGGPIGTKQYEEQKNQTQKKVVKVKLVCTSLILSYNKIGLIKSFYEIIDSIMWDCSKLGWIDLSHNQIEKLDYDFSDFPNLKCLYLHKNYLYDLKDLQQLGHLGLRSLTIHGNPIETIPNFRLYIVGMLPELRKLDTVLISGKERDNAQYWRVLSNTKIPEAKNPAKPPVQIVNEKDKEKQQK